VWCGPTHYFVNPNLEIRLSWAVTTRELEIKSEWITYPHKGAFLFSKKPLQFQFKNNKAHQRVEQELGARKAMFF
jgi:hypothetical protein